MTSLDNLLWERIATHEMPEDSAGKPFLKQMMAEYHIFRDTAEVAISEYRKFMYLCATRRSRNVPSKAVDLVWHLHMQHSRDYWEVFCVKLNKRIHHNPGVPRARHLEDYKATVEAYKDLFGTPPKGIWKEHNRVSAVLSLVFSAAFVFLGFIAMLSGFNPIFTAVLLSLPMLILAKSLLSLTSRGEFTLTFETGDLFSDNQAGDCGSGDCGGCGD